MRALVTGGAGFTGSQYVHCRGIQLVLERGEPGGIYHIGGGPELFNLGLTQAILECCGFNWEKVEYVPDRKGYDRRYSLDYSLLRNLGYAPRIDFGEGLGAPMRRYRENRSWWEPLKRASSRGHGVGNGGATGALQAGDGHR